MLTKPELQLALRLSLGELNVKMHSSTLTGLVNHVINHLERINQEDLSRQLVKNPTVVN